MTSSNTASKKPLSPKKKKKHAQCESCEISFIWEKNEDYSQETASQKALRKCSEEVGGGQNVCDFSEGG